MAWVHESKEELKKTLKEFMMSEHMVDNFLYILDSNEMLDLINKIDSNNNHTILNKIAKIVVDKGEDIENTLINLGYEKRGGSAAYPSQLKTIVIIPTKKWYWYDTDVKRGHYLVNDF